MEYSDNMNLQINMESFLVLSVAFVSLLNLFPISNSQLSSNYILGYIKTAFKAIYSVKKYTITGCIISSIIIGNYIITALYFALYDKLIMSPMFGVYSSAVIYTLSIIYFKLKRLIPIAAENIISGLINKLKIYKLQDSISYSQIIKFYLFTKHITWHPYSTNFIFYWLLYLPISFYVIFALIDSTYTGAPSNSSRQTKQNLHSKLYILENLCLFILTSIITTIISSILALKYYVDDIIYVLPSTLIAYCLYVYYLNPILYTHEHTRAYVVELRWIVTIILAIELSVTTTNGLKTTTIPGFIGGVFLILSDVICNFKSHRNQFKHLDQFTIFESSFYIFNIFCFPFTIQSSQFTHRAMRLWIQKFGINRWTFQTNVTLWNLLNQQDIVARCIIKLYIQYLFLLPWAGKFTFRRNTHLLAGLGCLITIYAMSSLVILIYSTFTMWQNYN